MRTYLKQTQAALILLAISTLSHTACTHEKTDPGPASDSGGSLSPGEGSDKDTVNGDVGLMGAGTGAPEASTGTTGTTSGSSPAPSPTTASEITSPTPASTQETGGATTSTTGTTSAKPASDNSETNKAHTDLTAADQSNNPRDMEITRQIRSTITDNDSLSTYARNVKIITRNGAVVLKGPVRSNEEKRMIEETARKVAGNNQVSSELTVSPQ